MRVKLPSIPLRVNHWLGLTALALVLAGCFQSAGSSVQPTSVDVNQLQNLPTPTDLIPTPLPPTPDVATQAPPPTTEGVADVPPTQPPPTDVIPPTDVPPAGDPPTATLALATLVPTQGVAAPAGDLQATPTPIPPMELPMTPTEGLPPTPTGLPTDQPCEHTVQPGEWFYSVARLYNIDPLDLVAANPRTNPNSLQVGDKLIIPNCGKTPTPAPAVPAAPDAGAPAVLATLTPSGGTAVPTAIVIDQMIYTVVSGDTLGRIAAQYGVTVDDIMKANNLTSDSLQIGQRLVIPVAPPQ